jgi:excisionase family DNA binding protein
MAKQTELERLLTVPEVAQVLNSSERTVWRLLANGDLESNHINKLVRIKPEAVRRYLERSRSK